MKNLSLLLAGPRYIKNLGFCLRTSELANVTPVYIYDEYLLLSESQRPQLIRISARAIRNHDVREITDVFKFLKENTEGYRRIAAVVDSDAQLLYNFEYGPNDLLVFGDEHEGLDDDLVSLCDEHVTVPQYNKKHKGSSRIQCYTLVSALDMFVYEFMKQRHFEGC
tara:strand:- start:491 stop:988 length:498 start_codon:yes stop_codon:yes gene_type:complete